jgi:hypothetical protein
VQHGEEITNKWYRDPRRERFLEYIPSNFRPHVVRLFNKYARKTSDPQSIVRSVYKETDNCEEEYKQKLREISNRYGTYTIEFAAWCVDFLNAPQEERDEYHELSKKFGTATYYSKTTYKQINALKALGYIGKIPDTKKEANKIISRLIRENEVKNIHDLILDYLPDCDVVRDDCYALRLFRMALFLGRLTATLSPEIACVIKYVHDDGIYLNVCHDSDMDENIFFIVKKLWNEVCQPEPGNVKFSESADRACA